MTGPEANQQYDLWVDRCRQQLERGAAGNALAAWMQSEGVSADMAAAILEAARGGPAVAADTREDEDAGPASPQATPAQPVTDPGTASTAETASDGGQPRAGESADHRESPAPAQHAPPCDRTATVFAKAFGRPAAADSHDPGPTSEDIVEWRSAPTSSAPPAGTDVSPIAPQPSAQPAAPTPPPTPDASASPVVPSPPDHTPPLQTGTTASAIGSPGQDVAADDATDDLGGTSTPRSAAEPAAEEDQATEPRITTSALPSNPFGTPRPPITFANVPAPGTQRDDEQLAVPYAPTGQRGGETEEPADVHEEAEASQEDGVGSESIHRSDPETTEPEPDPVDAADPEPDDGLVPEAADDRHADPGEPDVSQLDEVGLTAEHPVPPTGPVDGQIAAHEATEPTDAAQDTDEPTAMAEPPAMAEHTVETQTPDSSLDDVGVDDGMSEAAGPDEPARFDDSLEEAASRMGADLRRSASAAVSESYEDFMMTRQERTPRPAETAGAEGSDDASNETGTELEQSPTKPRQKSAKERKFGRRSAKTAMAETAGGGDETMPADDRGDGDGTEPATPASADEPGSELARAIREAAQDSAEESEVPPPRAEPKTEEELAAAAKKLGIRFRDDPEHAHSAAVDEDEDEMTRAARELGIKFRDDPDVEREPDPEDENAKAARELGISFRDDAEVKREQKSTLRRYWPIILVMALAAIAMPIAATLLLFSGD